MWARFRLLDLFCGAGGAARGYQQAGFHVTGIDHLSQPRYVGDDFFEADALIFLAKYGKDYDVIHASPPCQPYSVMKHFAKKEHQALIPQVREALRATRRPYVIENVVGAPLDWVLQLCGSMFGLHTHDGAELRRHRRFESSVLLLSLGPCEHGDGPVLGLNGHHWRNGKPYMQRRKLSTISVAGGSPRGARRQTITVTGQTAQQNVVRNGIRETFTMAQAREAMGITWMTRAELSQAIPPAYTAYIGQQIRNCLAVERGARGAV